MTDPRAFDEHVGNILKFTGATRPESGAVFILVLGATGSGKTTFVSRCSGKTLDIGHVLSSCTSDLTITSFLHPSPADPTDTKTIYLLDTPGFDDTNLSDSETLTRISHYLAVAYANCNYISGIILMHRIIDPRLSGTARLNLEMFKHMLGETAYENVAIITSMWSTPPTEREIQREKMLIQGEGLLAEVLQGGGRAFRYSGFDVESGQSLPLSVIDYLLHQARAGAVVLQIQNELVDENRDLIDTSAGQFLADRQVLGLRREYDATIRGIRDGILSSGLLDIQDGPLDPPERRQAKDRIDSEFMDLKRKPQENQANLSKSLLQIHHDEERRLTAQMSQLEADLDARIAAKQEYLEQLTTATTTNPPSSPVSSNPGVAPSTELEIMYLRRDIQELRLEIEQKQAANNSVRNAFRSGMLFDTVGRVIGGVVATAVPALVAGSLCVLM